MCSAAISRHATRRPASTQAVTLYRIQFYILRILAILLYFAAQVSCNRNLRCIWRGPAPSRWAVTWFLSHFYLSAFWQQHFLCAELGGHRVPQLSLLSGALCLHILVPTEAVQQNQYARGNYEITYQLLHISTQISFGLCLIVLTVKVSCIRVDVSGLKIIDNECYSKYERPKPLCSINFFFFFFFFFSSSSSSTFFSSFFFLDGTTVQCGPSPP